MSKEYELAFRMNAELDAKFSRVFTSAYDKIGDLERKLNGLDQAGKGGSFGKGIVKGLTLIGKAAGLATGAAVAGGVLAAGYAVKNSIEKAMDFESELATIQALTGSTGAEMTKMQTLALKMGANTKYSAMEAAQGIEELLKAGLTPAAVQAGGLEAALNLATAGGLELADSAEIMSTALNSYRKDAISAADVSNILAGTANASATSVEELRYSLAEVSSVASGIGMSFKDTNIALGLFANNGVKGQSAGTSLKTMLATLQPSTKEQTILFKKLGLMTTKGANAFFDASGNLKSLDDIAGILQKSMKKLTNQQRQLALRTIFGSGAQRAGNILYEEGTEGVKEFRNEMSKTTALDVARKKMDNAAGAVEQFKGAIETLQISALLPTMPIIKDLANSAADLVSKYTPQITAAVQNMVDSSKAYVKEHFIDDPEFQKLTTFGAKVDFIFKDVAATFNDWWAETGSSKLETISSTVTQTMINAMSALAPEFADVGLKIGASIGSGMWDGISNSKAGKLLHAMSPDWAENFVSGKTNIGQAVLDQIVPDWVPVIGDAGKPKTITHGYTPDELAAFITPPGMPMVPPKLPGYADGGFSNRPSIFGEAGLEAAIPIDNSNRSRGLWETAGRMIGALPSSERGSTGSFHFNPTYNFYGNADQGAVKQMEQRTRSDFAKEFEAWKRQQGRVSLG